MRKRKITFPEADTTNEQVNLLNEIFTDLNVLSERISALEVRKPTKFENLVIGLSKRFEKIEQALLKSKPKKKGASKVKSNVAKMIIFVLLLTSIAFGAVPVNDINFYSVQPHDTLVQLLRNKFTQVNNELATVEDAGKGSTFYVDSSVTNAGNGQSWASAVETLDEAIALCTANNGDIIRVAQGHAETWSTAAMGVTVDIIGVTIIGQGSGTDTPTFTYTHADATIDVSVANVTINNLRFVSGVSAVVSSITLAAGADYLTISGCEWVTPGTAEFEFYDMITLASGSDYVTIVGNVFASNVTTTGCNQAINGDAGVVNRLVVIGNEFSGQFIVAGIHSDDIDLNILIASNVFHNATTTQHAIEFTAAATGVCAYNIMYTDTIASTLNPGSLACFENYVINTTDLSAVRVPVDPAISVSTQTAGSVPDILSKLYYAADGTGAFPATVANDSTIAKMLASGSTATASTFDNTTMSLQAIRAAIDALTGVNLSGTATGSGAAATFISTDGLNGFGDDYFNTGWSMIIVYDAGAAGGAPEGDVRDIVDYVSTTGTFTVAPVWSGSQSTATGDKAIVVRHETLDDYAVAQSGGSGKILYVDASQPGTPDVGDLGLIWDLSYTTIAAAIAGATANNGDVIHVAAGHTETIGAAQLTWNVAGVRIIGRGVGSTMPIINFDDAASSIDVTAADIYVEGIRFRTEVDDCLLAIDLAGTSDGFHIKNCIFDADTATDEFLETIEFKAAAAANVTIEGCEFYADDTADATEAIISEVGASDNTKIIGNTFIGSWVVSSIYFSQAHTNMLVKDNVIQNFQTGQHSFESTAASTGLFVNNTMHGDTITAILDPGSLMCNGNIGSILINEAGVTLPLSADTTGVTTAADGSDLERLEWLQLRSDNVLASLGRDTVAANVFYVDSVAAIGGAGTSWATSETTLKAAIDNVTSNVDSVIFVASNHTEEFTASVAVDAPGVTIIGLGQGGARPIFTFNNTAAALTHTVADVRYVNVVFQCTTADSTVGISLDGSSDGAKFTDCEWLSTGAFEFLSSVTLASACDDVEFYGCKFNNLTAGTGDATAAITNIAGVTDGMVIDNCEFYGLWSTAAISSDDADTDVMIRDCVVKNTEPGVHAVLFTAAALGSVVDNMIYTDSYGIGLDPGSMGCFGNKHVWTTDMGAMDVPLIAGKSYTLTANQASITATTDPLFAIVGGPILITDFYGVVDTQCGVSTMLIQSVDTETSTTFPYTSAVAVDNDVVGTTYTFTGAVVSVLTPLAGAHNRSDTDNIQWYAPAGTIDQLGADAVAGVIDWYMTFTPMAPGVVVTDDS